MKQVIKQLFSFVLPITVLILIPIWIEPEIPVKHLSTFIDGIFLMGVGLFLMTCTISAFITFGKGTLVPWSPTRK